MSASQPALPAPTTPHRQPAINGFLAFILRSQFHGLASKSNLLISYRGRRTGLLHELPVRYASTAHGFIVRIGRPEAKRWWRNFSEPWPLTAVVRGACIPATGHVIPGDSDEGTELAAAYFGRYRGSARHQGLRVPEGETPSREDVRRAAAGLLFLVIVPDGGVPGR
jgi:hypothetical protein